jgi:hypothetical protein
MIPNSLFITTCFDRSIRKRSQKITLSILHGCLEKNNDMDADSLSNVSHLIHHLYVGLCERGGHEKDSTVCTAINDLFPWTLDDLPFSLLFQSSTDFIACDISGLERADPTNYVGEIDEKLRRHLDHWIYPTERDP